MNENKITSNPTTGESGIDMTSLRASFLTCDDKGRPKKINQNKIFEYLKAHGNFKIWHRNPYIYEHGVYVEDTDGIKPGVRIKAQIMDLIWPDFRTPQLASAIYDRVTMDRDFLVEDEATAPRTWINFENGFFDAATGETHPHDPAIFSLNQIPYRYDPNEETQGPATDAFLAFTLYKEGALETFLEYCGLSLTTDTTLQKFLLLTGQGGNGKSVLIDMAESIIGARNISRMTLDKINGSRFATSQMVGKLANLCADLKTDAKKDTQNLKQLTGDDGMDAEFKGVRGFSFRPYAKMLFSSNEVPRLIGEESDAIYRRMMILTIDRKPEKPDITLKDKLKAESPHFLHLAVDALRRLYERGAFPECPSSAEAVERAKKDNNSVDAFLADRCEIGPDLKWPRPATYEAYREFCIGEGRIPKSNVQFYAILRAKGHPECKVRGNMMIRGLAIKPAEDENPDGLLAGIETPTFGEPPTDFSNEPKRPTAEEIAEGMRKIQAWMDYVAPLLKTDEPVFLN